MSEKRAKKREKAAPTVRERRSILDSLNIAHSRRKRHTLLGQDVIIDYFFLWGKDEMQSAASNEATDASAAVQRFLSSISGTNLRNNSVQRQHADLPYPYLNHLLPPPMTIPMVTEASECFLDSLLNYLPPSIILMAADAPIAHSSTAEPDQTAVEAAKTALSTAQKRDLITRVLRSPQFHQALGTLTMALRDGGLPTIADALGVNVENGGYIQQGGMPLGGGHAIKAFVDGVIKSAKEKQD